MGALAPVTHWIPEDDLLLKNAVEAGASLESLAKGAVSFSRRFTIRELQDRWYSLLYDADISAEASAHIVEIELSVSSLPKSNKSCTTKGKEWQPGKRKMDSVRSHYYAMRKRIQNDPCNPVDLDFLVAPDVNVCTANATSCEEQLKFNTEHSARNCVLGDPMSNGFAQHEAGFEILHHDFSRVVTVEAGVAANINISAHTFHNGHLDSLGHRPTDDGVISQECLFGFAENATSGTVSKSVGKNINKHSFAHGDLHKGISEFHDENSTVFQTCSRVQEMEPSQSLPAGDLFETDKLEVKTVSSFDSMNNNQVNVCSGFGGNRNFNSPCSASFHQLGYSSPLPSISMWRTIEGVSAPVMQIEANLEVKDHCVGADLRASSMDVKKVNSPGYNDICPDSKLNGDILGDALNGSNTISEGDFIELSNSLLNFEDEEDYMDVDDKDLIDRSCLGNLKSILLSSPNDVHEEEIANVHEPMTSTILDTCSVIPGAENSEKTDDIGDVQNCASEFNVPSTTQNCNSLEPEQLVCSLNTEDPEIPCNDDVFSFHMVCSPPASYVLRHLSGEASNSFPPLNRESCDEQKACERESAVMEVREAILQSSVASQMGCPLQLPNVGLQHPNDPHSVNSTLDENGSSFIVSKHVGISVEQGKHKKVGGCMDSVVEKPIQGAGHSNNLFQNTVDACEPDVDEMAISQRNAPSQEDLCSGGMILPEPVTNVSSSDHEQLLYESEDDVPYFSDIEAMILDMDLHSCDEDSYYMKEVSRLQHEDTRKAIVRLEQAAHSYTQRAITFHGAFAVFYGRCLKHYIKKTEVSLGRATEDVNVDIDLGREGRANKISRRQAIIKMEEDGSFFLKNLGKCSISVNGKEVPSGRCFNLTSGSLIEIRDMRFIFEMKQSFASRCTASIMRRKITLEKNIRSECVPI